MDMSATTVINQSPEVVYRYVSDPGNDVHWRRGVTNSGLATQPPLRLGSEGFASAGTQTSRWRVTAFVPGSSVDWDLTDGPFKGTGGYRIEEADGMARFTLVADLQPGGFLRLLGPIFGWMGRRQNQADVERLKALLESNDVRGA